MALGPLIRLSVVSLALSVNLSLNPPLCSARPWIDFSAAGVTWLSLSGGGGALLPPSDSIMDLPALPAVRRVKAAQPKGRPGSTPGSEAPAMVDELQVEGRGAVGLASVWRGIVDRVFSVSPATDLRDLLLINAGASAHAVLCLGQRACMRAHIHVSTQRGRGRELQAFRADRAGEQQMCREASAAGSPQDPDLHAVPAQRQRERASDSTRTHANMKHRKTPQARPVTFNFSSHVLDELVQTHSAGAAPAPAAAAAAGQQVAQVKRRQKMFKMNGRVASNLDLELNPESLSRLGPYGNESVLLWTSLVVADGDRPVCCGGCIPALPNRQDPAQGPVLDAAGAAPSPSVQDVNEGAGVVGEGAAPATGGKGGERRYQVWRGELADAERQREVEYDGQLLVDAIVPLGVPLCIRVCMCICARV